VERTWYGAVNNGSLAAKDATRPDYRESMDLPRGRIFVQVNRFLQAIDAKAGKLVETFDGRGRVDMKEGMTRPTALPAWVPGAPARSLKTC
jgi:glucose dehydrogenase